MNIETNVVFEHLTESQKRYVVEQGGTRCLIGSTLIRTPSGNKPIKDIRIGESVLSYKNGQVVERVVVNKYRYKAERIKKKLIKFVINGHQITSTREHRFFEQGNYIAANDIAERMLEGSREHEWSLSNQQFRSVSNDEPSRKVRTFGKGGNNETGRRTRIFENINQNRRQVQVGQGSPVGCVGVSTESKRRSEPHQPQSFRQSRVELGMGNTPREHRPYDETRTADDEQWFSKRNVEIDGTDGSGNQIKIQTLQGNGEGLGEGIQRFKSGGQRCFARQNVETRWVDKIDSVEFVEPEDVFDLVIEDTHNYILDETGIISHNSGKTFNILIWLIVESYKRKGLIISVVRKTFPSLRTSVMRDFFQILEDLELYDVNNHNKTESTYKINGGFFEFISVDTPQKIRGRKRNICFVNEANEITKEDYFQLNIRTTERMVLDFNPSEDFWIYDEVVSREDCDFHITTYLDNPFLPKTLVQEIERLKDVDEFYWKVYGLGQKAAIRGVILTNWEQKEFTAEDKTLKGYGMDFGFTNDPTTLIEIREQGGELWLRELIFQVGLTNQDIAERLKDLKIESDVVADSAEPKSIEELRREGFNVRGAVKGKDSIRSGIDLLRRYKINIHPNSVNLIKEFKSYKYKQDANGEFTNVPVDKFNHGIDALRYFVNTNMNGSGYGDYSFL